MLYLNQFVTKNNSKCLCSIITDIAFEYFFLLLMPRASSNFAIISNNPFLPLTNLSVTKLRCFSLPILLAFNKFSIISLGSYSPVVMFLAFTSANGLHPQILSCCTITVTSDTRNFINFIIDQTIY